MEPGIGGGQRSAVVSTSAIYEPESNFKEYVQRHFERTLDHIRQRKEEEEGADHWTAIL